MPKSSKVTRELAFRQLKEIYDIAQRAESDSQRKPMLFACYADVKGIVDNFNAAHLKIIQECDDARFDAEDQVRTDFNGMHYRIKAVYYTLKQSTSTSVQAQVEDKRPSKIKLPKISLLQREI